MRTDAQSRCSAKKTKRPSDEEVRRVAGARGEGRQLTASLVSTLVHSYRGRSKHSSCMMPGISCPRKIHIPLHCKAVW